MLLSLCVYVSAICDRVCVMLRSPNLDVMLQPWLCSLQYDDSYNNQNYNEWVDMTCMSSLSVRLIGTMGKNNCNSEADLKYIYLYISFT